MAQSEDLQRLSWAFGAFRMVSRLKAISESWFSGASGSVGAPREWQWHARTRRWMQPRTPVSSRSLRPTRWPLGGIFHALNVDSHWKTAQKQYRNRHVRGSFQSYIRPEAFSYKGDAPAARSCSEVFLQPGTAIFSNQWYGGLPAHAPAESCASVCCRDTSFRPSYPQGAACPYVPGARTTTTTTGTMATTRMSTTSTTDARQGWKADGGRGEEGGPAGPNGLALERKGL